MDYMINPVKMGGLVKAVNGDNIKIHLHGRLGVITVKRNMILSDEEIVPGHDLEFYFSYIQVVDHPENYDSSSITVYHEVAPCLIGGTLTQVNDTAVEVTIMDNLGTIAVPRRWVFTPVVLKEGQQVEFSFSCMTVKCKRDISVEMI